MAVVDVVDSYLEGLPGETRRLARGEWGVTLEPDQAAGWPLHVGLRLADGVLHAQAHALEDSEGLDPCGCRVTSRPATWTRRRSIGCSGWW